MTECADNLTSTIHDPEPNDVANEVVPYSVSVLLVGYSTKIRGGITGVTTTLLTHMPNVELFEALKYYRPLYKQILFTVGAYFRFARRMILDRPQVVHILIGSRFDLVRNSFYVILSRLFGIQVIIGFRTNRNAVFNGFSKRLRQIFVGILSLAQEFCFLSPRLRTEMLEFLMTTEKGVVIPNPVPASYLKLPPISREKRTGNLLFLGRWMREKGVEELSRAMAELTRSDNLQCICHGDVSAADSVEGCVFGGWIEGDAKLQAIREAIILLLPSHAEAYPNVLIEAAACGTPFIATRIGGVPDIAATSGGGIVCDVGDVEGLVDAVRLLVSNVAAWQQCSDNGRRWAETCSTEDIVLRWQALYSAVATVK